MATKYRTHLDLAPHDALGLLRRLASDDEFRAQLIVNPEKVLTENGISVPVNCLHQPVTLPTKEEIGALAGAPQVQSGFRVGDASRKAGRGVTAERRPSEFGPPSDDSERSPAEFGPPPDDSEHPPTEGGPSPSEFGPPRAHDSEDDEAE